MNTAFTPLKVVFELATPVIPADKFGLHLDGLLAYAVLQQALLNDPSSLPCAGDFDRLTNAGLDDILQKDPCGVYRASMLDFNRDGCDMLVGMVRRTEDYGIALAKANYDAHEEEFRAGTLEQDAPMIAEFPKNGATKPLRLDKINLASGEHRNFQFFLPAFHASTATAWCIGDKDRIEALLRQHIGAIGRKGTAGYGAVKSITVEMDESAQEKWMRRAMPEALDGYSPVMGNYFPPYWKAVNRQVVWVPQ